jgi:hypothetical protein
MADEPNQGTSQSSQGTQGQSGSGDQSATQGATQGSTQGSTQSSTSQTQSNGQTAPSRPDWLPEKFFDAKAGPKWDDFGKHFNEVATRDAANEVKRLSLPQKPEEYKLELPKDFKLPQGVEFKLDTAKPEFSKFQQVAHKHGLAPDAVTDMLGVYAETLVGSQASIQQAYQAEINKLGANGPARVTAIDTFFTGLIGAQKAGELKKMMVTAGITEALESVVAKFSTQGAASFTQLHRETPEPQGRVSEEQWKTMSPAARLDYNRRFPQDKMPEWRDPRAA